jgi:hypothetical protein
VYDNKHPCASGEHQRNVPAVLFGPGVEVQLGGPLPLCCYYLAQCTITLAVEDKCRKRLYMITDNHLCPAPPLLLLLQGPLQPAGPSPRPQDPLQLPGPCGGPQVGVDGCQGLDLAQEERAVVSRTIAPAAVPRAQQSCEAMLCCPSLWCHACDSGCACMSEYASQHCSLIRVCNLCMSRRLTVSCVCPAHPLTQLQAGPPLPLCAAL